MINLKSICLLLIIQIAFTLTVADFKPALFHTSKPSGFYAVNTGIDNTGFILAFGDLNGDKYTDYIATDDPTTKQIDFYYWNDGLSQFASKSFTLNTSNFIQIAEIMICDVDSDGLPEIVVTYLIANSVYSSEIYDVNCKDTCQIVKQNLSFTKLTNMNAVPFLIDIGGTGKISFFTVVNNQRNIVQYSNDSSVLYKLQLQWKSLLLNPPQSFNDITMHFASIIDINGDCNSDLVLVSNDNNKSNSIIQFYSKTNNNNYKQQAVLSIKKNITWLTFTDIDANGAIDLFFVVLENGLYVPYVILNKNSLGDICSWSGNFPFKVDDLQVFKLPNGYGLVADSNVKFADFNFDGLPDILAIFSVKKFKKTSILINYGSLSFDIFNAINIEQISNIDHPSQACIFDFTQNGKIDLIIINQVTKQDGTKVYVRTSIVNNIIEDTLFIKILPLLSTSSSDFQGININSGIGVTVQWRITNLNGDKTISVLNQKFQWNYGTLQLPFVTIGLGRTNNYVEDLTVGYPGYGQLQTWTPIIPNSQLLVKRQASQDWQLQTLLKDNSRVYDVIYISIICLLILGLVIFYLNWRESQQDKRDHYNFIQMIR